MSRTAAAVALCTIGFSLSSPLQAAEVTKPLDHRVYDALSNGSVFAEVRLFDFSRHYDYEQDQPRTLHDSSLGGLFGYRSQALDYFSLGFTFASANPIWSRNNNTYGLLGADHQSVNRVQEYFVQYDDDVHHFTLGAHKIVTPWMHPHDIRALPRTFRGASYINNYWQRLTLSAYVITDSMGWVDNRFVSVAQALESAVASKGLDIEDKPMWIGGVQYHTAKENDYGKWGFKADGWQYYMQDAYTQSYLKLELNQNYYGVNWFFRPSYFRQQDIGRLNKQLVDTWQYGTQLGAGYNGGLLTLIYSRTGDDALVTPWGHSKGVIQQVFQSGRAQERSYAVKFDYDFAKLEIDHLKAHVMYGDFKTPNNSGASKDFKEYDLQVTYNFAKWVKGFSTKIRYAYIDYEDSDRFQDLQLHFYYKFNLN